MRIKLTCFCLINLIFLTPGFGEITTSEGPSSLREQNVSGSAVSHQELTVTKPFILIRHGETDYNAKGLTQGSIDIPLNEEGRDQALKAGKELQGKGVKKIYSSNLSRAIETAEIIRTELQIKEPVVVDAGLAERNWGDLEGTPMNTDKKRFEPNFQPKGGETLTMFRSRVNKVFLEILNKNEEGVLIVAHGGTIRTFLNLIGSPQLNIKNAVPIYFTPPSQGQKEWKIKLNNPK